MIRIASVVTLPHRVADDHYLLVAELFFLRQEIAAQDRFHLKQAEEVPGGMHAPHLFRLAAPCEAVKPRTPGGELLKHMVLFAPVEKLGG